MNAIEIKAAIFFGVYIFFLIESFVLIGTVQMDLSFLNPIRNYNMWTPEDFYVSVNDEAIMITESKRVTYYDFNLNVLCEN